MVFNSFHNGIWLRVTGLALTIVLAAWLVLHTQWYVSIFLLTAMALFQIATLVQFATRSSREVARFFESVSFDDVSQTFPGVRGDSASQELASALRRVLDRLRSGRAEREEQAQYLQALVAHVPVALVAVDEAGGVQLLNIAARRLFEGPCTHTAQFARYGEAFAAGLEALRARDGVILRMERPSGTLQLKVSATDIALNGARRRILSLQNIEAELSAREFAAWQAVIRVMAHEVMNSLTPLSSLAGTAQERVNEVLEHLPPDDANRAALADAAEALDAMTRRSQGLLNFVQNHRRLTKRMVAQMENVSTPRAFARLQRLLANDLAARNIALTVATDAQNLEIAVDPALLDQALINLVRNAIEALRDRPDGRIELSAYRDPGGRAVIAVIDNGPGIAPESREKVFVPFFSTKRDGSGVGLTLVRQIAVVHGGTVDIAETPGGGATIALRF